MGRPWTVAEDELLARLVNFHGKQWGVISSQMENRSAAQIAARWEKCLDPKLAKGPFTVEEDRIIAEYAERNGPQNWPGLAQILPQRSPKQCRERWCNHLNPAVSNSAWTLDEDRIIFEHYERLGPKWSIIAHSLPGRTDNAVKNRWNSSISKRIRLDELGRRGIGPASGRKVRRQPTADKPSSVKVPEKAPAPQVVPIDISQLQPWQVHILQQMNILQAPPQQMQQPQVPPPQMPPQAAEAGKDALSSPFRFVSPSPSPFTRCQTLPTPGSIFAVGDGTRTPISPNQMFDMNVFK
jgi:hypothetical protein